MATTIRTEPTQARPRLVVTSAPERNARRGLVQRMVAAVRLAWSSDERAALDGWQGRAEIGRATGVRC